MIQRKMKTVVWIAAVLTFVLLATACSGGGNNDAGGAASPAAASSGSASPGSSPVDSPESPSPSASSSTEAQTASGEFAGTIDGHTIEIKVDGTATAYQVDPETFEKVSTWDENTRVKFQFTENTIEGQPEKQRTITAIDKE